MRICIVNPFYDVHWRSILGVSGHFPHLELLSSALARRGHDVVVVQALDEERTEHINSVEFRYVRTPHRSAPRLAGGRLGVDFLLRSNVKRVIEAADNARPDAVYMIGLTLLQPLLEVGRWCSKTGRPLIACYHGGRPRREPWLRPVERHALGRCRAVFFPTERQAQPWIDAGLLRRDQVLPCMEVSSNFAPAPRLCARARTGMGGSPVFVWNAGLNRRKDPVTALNGFSLIREVWREARLYMIYLSNEMEPEIRHRISSDPALCDAVEMRGRIPHEAVADFLNSADFLLQSSLNEIGSYSVLEAMSCGVIPVVTNIPLFEAVTDNGRLGIVFPVGDHRAMAQRVLKFDLANLGTWSREIRGFFERFLSYDAIARTYEAALANCSVGAPSSRDT